tara:strand:- start:1548 stop:2570 length:1023 start_codon:yes stop_codon:yes gene_type:complete
MNQKWIEDFVNQHSEFTRIQGDELRARCPLPKHNDGNPSFAINLKTGKWNCMGCSSAGKSIESLVARVLGISIYEANNVVDANNKITPYDTLQIINNIKKGIVKYRHREPIETEITLPPKAKDQSPGIRYFLSQRAKQNKNEPYTKEQVKEIYRNFACFYCGTGKYRSRIICPVLNQQYSVVYQTNRAIDRNPIKTMFPTREESGQLGKHYLGEHLQQDSPIIVEGLFSAFRVFSFGHEVISPLTCRLSKSQIRNIANRYKAITLCFDNDPLTENRKSKPGIDGMRRAYAALRDLLETKFIILPEGKDPDDLTKTEFNNLTRETLSARENKELTKKLAYQ